MVIAIDGPAGSGKGTVAKILSEKLNLVNIDTGATYRCLALKALKNNCTNDKEKIIELSKNIDIKFDVNGNVYLDSIDVTKEIRSREVTNIVSPISSIVEVRKNLADLQRKMATSLDVVMEGRDITTVILPNADFKFYLDASLEERVNRRMQQNKEKNIDMSYEEVYENIKARDYNDSHKEVGSLIRTDEQIYIDSTNLKIEEVVDLIMKEVLNES
ncbi:MAG: (d)CMP kinase [Candidatus Faecisoma sp.]|jgi:cytidylate kinase|nr:(d)CMP kinase [Acholeplasma sp.]MCI5677519.1 (d)CMP kinase [Acholeplasma sp.]MDY2892514.1 (d)CMP kinase [Candidatus Faecisoma sp.]